MIGILNHSAYRHLFLAQALSLLGSGLTTVALGLLAYQIAGSDAGLVLGTALAIKMIAYVVLGPIGAALSSRFRRGPFLVALDLVRAGFVCLLPFVTEIWQIYLLIFLFQACSAAFTPTFQATIPDLLPEERDYTRALSLSRLLYDLEQLASPALAGLLLSVMTFHGLFVGNALGFLASAALIVTASLPAQNPDAIVRSFRDRVSRGSWIYLKTPRLRGLLALSFAVSAAGSMVIVNTVVFVRDVLGGSERDVTLFYASAGLGSMLVALTLPRLLEHRPARPIMLAGGVLLSLSLCAGTVAETYLQALAAWCAIGIGTSMVMTPSGLLLRQSCHPEDRTDLFAAQFALSHACWLVAYPLAGWVATSFGMGVAFLTLAAGAATGLIAALVFWPEHDPVELTHEHEDLVHEHPIPDDGHHQAIHPVQGDPSGQKHRHHKLRHSHTFIIDDHHTAWPRG
ncbi:MFS transporter [Nisaea nitritireducens]|uniref:MFS transporter n=1 Tax=Nisaea nitritireducens TaxID=568392 RepID=UPI001868DD8A|nr:MFS transporter [Nisaea nitritireducens]